MPRPSQAVLNRHGIPIDRPAGSKKTARILQVEIQPEIKVSGRIKNLFKNISARQSLKNARWTVIWDAVQSKAISRKHGNFLQNALSKGLFNAQELGKILAFRKPKEVRRVLGFAEYGLLEWPEIKLLLLSSPGQELKSNYESLKAKIEERKKKLFEAFERKGIKPPFLSDLFAQY